MKINKKLAALFLLSACVFTQTANAAEDSALEQIVSNFVKTAVNTASAEIDVQIEKALATASDFAGFENDNVSNSKVTIVDLPNTQELADASEESELKEGKTTTTSEQTTVE